MDTGRQQRPLLRMATSRDYVRVRLGPGLGLGLVIISNNSVWSFCIISDIIVSCWPAFCHA